MERMPYHKLAIALHISIERELGIKSATRPDGTAWAYGTREAFVAETTDADFITLYLRDNGEDVAESREPAIPAKLSREICSWLRNAR